MAVIINASPTNGLVQTADGSGKIKLQANGVTTNALAWVNFNGTGTVAIRSSYNVSSITDNGTGQYTVNFATALSDANYAAIVGFSNQAGTSAVQAQSQGTQLTTSIPVIGTNAASSAYVDLPEIAVVIFGN